MKIKVKKWPHFKGELPRYQSEGASGFDIRAQIDAPITLQPGARILVATGLSFETPLGFEIQCRPRSGWALKNGMSVVNTPGTIDADYRGEVKVILINLGQEPVVINDQERIAQFVVTPIIQVEMEEATELADSVRGAGGFGSTGRHP